MILQMETASPGRLTDPVDRNAVAASFYQDQPGPAIVGLSLSRQSLTDTGTDNFHYPVPTLRLMPIV